MHLVSFQPPWDLEVGKKFIIHYTYGCDYNLKVKDSLSLSQLLFTGVHYYFIIEMVVHLLYWFMPCLFACINLLVLSCQTFFLFKLNSWSLFISWVIYFKLVTLQGELTYGKIGEWRFDKRSFLSGPPPKNLTLPPPGVPESVVCLCLIFIPQGPVELTIKQIQLFQIISGSALSSELNPTHAQKQKDFSSVHFSTHA